MNHTTLEKIISETQSSPYIKWNDESLADLIRNDNVYNVVLFREVAISAQDTWVVYSIHT